MKGSYFFGVLNAGKAGHYLYDDSCRQQRRDVEVLPCCSTPDGVFLRKPAELYKPQVWWTDGWTVYAMWDCSGDSRPGSSSTFMFPQRGLSGPECWDLVVETFPEIAKRIETARFA